MKQFLLGLNNLSLFLNAFIRYYPNGHREFLKSHPDAVGKALKTVIRQTLWERAEREKAKIMKDGLKKQGVFVAKLEAEKNVDDNGGTKFSSDWWNDEWLEGVKGKLGNYPLVCVVKDVYAEFPPDPNAEHKVVIDDGIGDVQIVWSLPANVSGKKTNKSQASICLVLNLKPLTSLLPPTVLKDPNSNRDQLQPPPNFSVILFPSNSNAKPFLVPFSWAYKLSHSIMLGDKVTVLTMGDMKGTVKGFATVNDSIGSCRFDDRLVEITAFLSSLKAGCEGLTAAPNMDLSSHPQRMSKSLMSFLPVTATFAVIERLSSFLDANSSCPEPMVASENLSDHALSDLIRSTLPIWESVTILSHGVSKSVIVSPWELSLGKAATKRQVNKIFQEATADLVAENGLIHIIEEPLRAKIECALEDFIKSEDDSVIFYDNVTEEIAPSYNCAVPQGMFFAKILRRIATHKTPFTTQPRCYYRTVEALMNDLTTILENCLLYNSPDSDVVHKVYQIIPSSKRIILDLVLKHVRDKDSQSQADNERKNAVLSHTKLSGVMNRSDGDVSKSKSAKKCIRAPKLSQLHGPYLESLHRAWIEDVGPDQTWTCPDVQVRISGSKYTHRGQNWVPQSGDFVLYSRSRHSKFVQAHFDAFTTYQSVLPFFKGLPSDEIYFATKDGSPSSISFDQRQGAVVDNLPGTLLSHWLVGKVVWVRAVFPRVPTKDCTATFKERSPLLSLGIKFEYSWAGAQQTNIIHWRPCTIQSMLGKSALNTLESMDLCDSCGLDDRFAFLYPAWLHNDIEEEGKLVYMESPILLPNTKGRISQPVFSKPNGLEKDEIASIDRCFNTLKRRCLGNISPDYVDPKCCMANIKAGWCPTAKSGRTLPTFERLLEIERFDDADRATSKRKIAIDRKWNNHEEEADAVSLLADIHYLPPLSIISYKAVCVQTKGAFEQPTQEIGRKYEETICPVPKLCLELVQQRLRNGYYRSRNGILNDIQEAYVNSSLLVLSKEASRKFGPPFSMRRIIKALSASDEKPSTKRKSKKRSSEKGAGTSPKAVQHKIVNSASSSAGEKKTSDNDLTLSNSPTQAMKAVNEAPLDPRDRSDEYKELKKPVLSEEENNWTEKVNTVKRLYATALVCVLETVHVERVFGTAPKDTKKMFVHSEETLNREKIFQVARNKLGLLIAAMIKDPCNNRIKGASMELPKVKVNISGLGMIGTVSNEKSNPNHIIFEPLDYFNNKDLIKTLFGKPGMSDSCAHCQVYRRNMLSCRVQRAHSCPDFNWIDVFQDVGGLDALLQMLRTGLPSVVAKSPTLTNDETDTRYTILDSASTNQVVEDVESAKQGNETKDEEYEDGEADFAKDKDEGDPYDNQEKALRALNLSHQILDRARNEVNCPLKLSETFIKSYFPIDPTDGKYTICVVCGLIGDVMCCEGQDCPVVSHPRCVGLEEVPRDDWFCIKCAPIPKLIEGKAESGDHVPMNDNGISDACATYNSTSLIPTAVLVPLYDPEVEEVKRAKEYETLNDELQNILEELKSKRYKPRPKVGVKETEIGANEDNSHDEYDQISQHGKLSIVAASVHGEQNDVENDDDGGVFIQVGSTRASTIQANIIPRKDVGGEVIDTNSLAGCMSVSTETLRKGTSAITVGSKISKHFFDQGDFTGIIKQLPTSDHPYYCVRYDDGDEEDLSENELQDLLFLSSQKKSDWLNRSDISIGSRAPKSGNFDSVDEQASEEPPHQRLISRPSKVSGSHRRGRPRGISKADPSDLRLTSGCKFSGMISAIGPIGQESERNDNEIFHSSPLSKRRSAGPTRQKLNKDVHISHHSLVKKKGQTNRENGTLVSGPMATPRKRGRPRKNKVEEKAQCTPQSTSDISNGESLSKKKKTEHSPLSLPRGRQRK